MKKEIEEILLAFGYVNGGYRPKDYSDEYVDKILSLFEKENNDLKKHCKQLEDTYIKIENTECPDCVYLKEALENAYAVRDEALANQVKLKKLLDKDRIVWILESWHMQANVTESKLIKYFDCEDYIAPKVLLEIIADEITGETT